MFRAGLALTTALVMVSGCNGGMRETARRLGNDLTLPSLYGDFQEERAANAARSEGRNPCLRAYRGENDEGPPGLEANLTLTSGVFLEWCRAANYTELRAENAFLSALGSERIAPENQPVEPPGMPSDWRVASEFAVQRYMDSGIALSDQLCEGYFQRMGLSDAALTFGDTLIADLGSAASGIQSITGVVPSTIGTTAAVLGFTGATVRNSRENFVFDGNIDSVYFLVRTHRQNYVEAVRNSPNPPKTFWRAYDWLNSYHTSCSYMSIRVMVDEAITDRASRAPSSNPTSGVVLSAAQRQILSQELAISTELTDADIVAAIALNFNAESHTFRGYPATELQSSDGQTKTTLGDFFRDDENGAERRAAVVNVLITAGNNVLGTYIQRAQRSIAQRSFEAAPAGAPAAPESEEAAAPQETPSPQGLGPTPQGTTAGQ